MSRVVVIGGGVIGLSTGYQLAKRGHRVVVLELGEPGAGCSSGNLGWTVPSLSEPLAAPGVRWESLRWMFKRDSPLYLDPRFVLSAPGWLWRFWRSCNQRDYLRGLEAMAALNRRTLELFDRLIDDGVRFERYRDGILFLYLTRGPLEAALREFVRLAELGLPAPEELTREAVMALEPALSSRVAGGALAASEGHVRPETLCAGLLASLRARGGVVHSGVEVTGAVRRGTNRVVEVQSPSGAFAGDAFVIAAGAWSGRIARRFGFFLPVQAGKGYSVTVAEPAARPNRALYLYEPRVGLSPFAGAVRLGGTMELSGINTRIVPARVAAIRRAGAEFLPGSERGDVQVEWTGMRPLTPDGLPVIGRAPSFDNVYVATGHAMLGVTLAPVTGLVLAELITDGTSSIDLRAFDPARFL
jgi:D-amino-acid dehydrogenase